MRPPAAAHRQQQPLSPPVLLLQPSSEPIVAGQVVALPHIRVALNAASVDTVLRDCLPFNCRSARVNVLSSVVVVFASVADAEAASRHMPLAEFTVIAVADEPPA